jgi:hypothetical protein
MMMPMSRALLGAVSLLLLAIVPALAAQAGDAQSALAELKQRHRTVTDEYRARLKAASAEERKQLQPPPVDEFVTGFAAIAGSAAGTETAAEAWMMVVQLAPQGSDTGVLGVAVERLARDHGTSVQAASLGSTLARAGGTLEPITLQGHLRTVVELAPKGDMQAGAMLALATSLGDQESTTAGSPAEQELESLLARLKQDYGDLEDARERSYAAVADGITFARTRLKVGLPVPEIEAADIQGVTFKLSDYRGKVVLVDFWGHW